MEVDVEFLQKTETLQDRSHPNIVQPCQNLIYYNCLNPHVPWISSVLHIPSHYQHSISRPVLVLVRELCGDKNIWSKFLLKIEMLVTMSDTLGSNISFSLIKMTLTVTFDWSNNLVRQQILKLLSENSSVYNFHQNWVENYFRIRAMSTQPTLISFQILMSKHWRNKL